MSEPSPYTRPVYIFGHRNPDADAICSAIGYAAYKKAIGHDNYEPARCGNTNARIDSILQHFGVPAPKFVGDVTPRVYDIMRRDVLTIKEEDTCAHALELIDEHDVRALPVVDEEQQLNGLVTIFDLGEFFTPNPTDLRKMRRVHTSISDIVDALKANTLNLRDEDNIEEMFVRIGAMDIRSFGRFSEEEAIETSQSIIIVGDRWDIQEKSLQLGVRLLVITGGLEVDEDIIERAKALGVCLIVSKYDSATTSWIIRTATRVGPLIDKNIKTFHPEEKLSYVKRKIAQAASPIYGVINDAGHLVGIFSKSDIIKPISTRIVMVDHNEIGQAVTGADEVTIEEVIDHHRLGNPPTSQPILFRNEPVGSTCTIVAGMFQAAGIEPEPNIAGVLMGGIIADTLNLQSPTSTARDAELVEWLAGIAKVEADQLAETIFSSGSVIIAMQPDEVIRSDCKIYEEGDMRFSVSQVEELGYDNFFNNAAGLKQALTDYCEQAELNFSVLLVTDINKQNSLCVVTGAPEVIEAITFAPTEHSGIFDMPNVVSRKKQLIPYFSNLVKNLASV